MSVCSEVRSGVYHGSVLGSILCNVGLYCLPIGDIFAKHNVRYHIYADDTQFYVECPPTGHTDASRQITECLEDLRRWLTDNILLLNVDKTEATLFRSSCPVASTINICGTVAQLKPTVCDIGVVFDTRLDMAFQVSSVCRSAYYRVFRIAKTRAILTIVACKTLTLNSVDKPLQLTTQSDQEVPSASREHKHSTVLNVYRVNNSFVKWRVDE